MASSSRSYKSRFRDTVVGPAMGPCRPWAGRGARGFTSCFSRLVFIQAAELIEKNGLEGRDLHRSRTASTRFSTAFIHKILWLTAIAQGIYCGQASMQSLSAWTARQPGGGNFASAGDFHQCGAGACEPGLAGNRAPFGGASRLSELVRLFVPVKATAVSTVEPPRGGGHCWTLAAPAGRRPGKVEDIGSQAPNRGRVGVGVEVRSRNPGSSWDAQCRPVKAGAAPRREV